jgi:threonine dehydrogenase-like Zn-dependent dehydrogenase
MDACRVVMKKGEVVLVGVPWKRCTDLSAHELLHAIFHRYVVLRSGWEWELPLHPTDFRAGSIWGNLAAALRWLGEGKVPLDGLIARYSPGQCQQAYQDLQHGRIQGLAVVFDWTQI